MPNYGPNCPNDWRHYNENDPTGCFFNTPKTPLPAQSLSNLGNLTFTATAAFNGKDTATIAVSPTSVYSASYYDNVLNLSKSWTAAEFNIFGDTSASNSSFNPGSSIGIQLRINAASGNTTPVCSNNDFSGYDGSFNGWTGETNNLNVKNNCTADSNAIFFTEANTPLIDTVSTPEVTPNSAFWPSGWPTGSANGNTAVTLSGTGFTGATQVTFAAGATNATPVPFDVLSDTQINTVSPACAPLGCGQGDTGEAITVTGPDGSDSAPQGLIPYSVVTNVNPESGVPGTKVTVSGNGFYNYGPTQSFLFGGVPAQNVVCTPYRNVQCTMTAPAGAPNRADVRFSGTVSPDGLSPINAQDVFTYTGNGAPTISSITPMSGSAAGGTTLVLTGTGFTQAMEAAFGSYYFGITGDCPTSTQCTITSPRSLGVSPVAVSVGGYAQGSPFSTQNIQFTYTAPPPSGVMTPSSGLPIGGTVVFLQLSHLVAPPGATQIAFDFNGNQIPAINISCHPATLNTTDSDCTFETPPLSPPGPGPVAVPVTVITGTTTLGVGNFTFQPATVPPSQCEVCQEKGGTCVTLNGRFFCRPECPKCGCDRSSPTGKCQ
jgi:hypothetical protein